MNDLVLASDANLPAQRVLLDALDAASDRVERAAEMEAGTWDTDWLLPSVLYADALTVLSRHLWPTDWRYRYFRRRFKTLRTRSILAPTGSSARGDELPPARIALEKEVARYRGRLAFEMRQLQGFLSTEPLTLLQLLREQMPSLTHEVQINLNAVLQGCRECLSDHMCPLVRRYSVGIAIIHGKACRVFDDLASILEKDWRDRGHLELPREIMECVVEWWEKNRSEAEACFREAS